MGSGFILRDSGSGNKPFARDALAVGLSGSAIATKGIEWMIVIDDLLAVRIRVDFQFAR